MEIIFKLHKNNFSKPLKIGLDNTLIRSPSASNFLPMELELAVLDQCYLL